VNAKDRFTAALRCAAVDRPPLAGVVTAISVRIKEGVSVRWPEAQTNAGWLAFG
jgi:hypothetical protein